MSDENFGFGKAAKDIHEPSVPDVGDVDASTMLPDGIEVAVVDTEVTADDDASVDILQQAQEDMAHAEANEGVDNTSLERELSSLLNRYSAEGASGTPDFIIAKFLLGVLEDFNEAVKHRGWWRSEFTDFNPSRDVKYFDHFTGEEIVNPTGKESTHYKKTGQFPNYSQWKESQE